MSQRGYSPRRYGRSEHAPIVIDMVDYLGDEYGDEFTYASSHYSSPHHSNSIHSTPLPTEAAPAPGAAVGISSHHSSPRRSANPRHSNQRHSSRQASRHSHSNNTHSSPHPSGNVTAHSSPRLSGSATAHSSPRQTVHMHNFAQRRSFMMGGFERPEDVQQPQEVESNRVYRVETQDDVPFEYDDYNMDRPHSGGIGESEYRQSPGRSRNFRQVDTRDRPTTPRSVSSMHRQGVSHNSNFSKGHQDKFTDDAPTYGSVGSISRFDNHHLETTPTQRHVHNAEEQQGATFPVFDRMKRPEESVFTFDSAADNDVHTVPGVINRPHSEGGAPQGASRESVPVQAPPTEKKVFYFDIDDLSQRLLSSGDQDLSRRLRKKKAKNARSRISRNRARRKSKKSVFNLELDGSATSALHVNDNTIVTAPEQLGLSCDSSKGGYNRFDSRSAAGSDARSALYVDTSADIDEFATKSALKSITSPTTRSDSSSVPLRRNPSVGSPPAEHIKGTVSPDATMDQDAESVQEKPMTPASPREAPARSRREPAKPNSPRQAAIAKHEQTRSRESLAHDRRANRSISEDERAGNSKPGAEHKSASPKQATRISTSPSVVGMDGNTGVQITSRKVKGAESSDMRVTQVYDEISDRLDHIVKRENDVENRQKAIRAVFEEVQQHVADLRKQKTQGKVDSSDNQEAIVDLVSISDKPKRNAADEGDDQVIKHQGLNESSDAEDIIVKLENHRNPMYHSFRQTKGRAKVRSPTIEDMVSPPIAPIAPPPPIEPIAALATSPKAPPAFVAPRSGSGPISSTAAQRTSDLDIENDIIDIDSASLKRDEVKVMKAEDATTAAPKNAKPSDQDVLVIDIDEKADEEQKDQRKNIADKEQKGVPSKDKRPSGYLSSDNSCDDEIVIHNQSTDVADSEGVNDVVYVIEEDDGKSIVHVEDKNMLEPETEICSVAQNEGRDPSDTEVANDSSSLEIQRFEAHGLPSGQDFADSVKSADSTAKEIHNCSDDEESSALRPLITIDHHENEDRLEPDGNRLEPTKTKDDADNSEEGDRDGESLVGLASNTMEEARKRTVAGPSLEEGVLDDSDTADEANVDIDKEFDAVVPIGKDDVPTMTYNIDETLNRVARQKELEEKEKEQKMQGAKKEHRDQAAREKSPRGVEKQSEPVAAKKIPVTTISRRDEEEKANALLDTFSNGSLFAGVEDVQIEAKHSLRPSRAEGTHSQHLESRSNLESFMDLEDDDASEGEGSFKKSPNSENEVVSLDYDFNLAISAASKSSSSTSDLQEFPMTEDRQYDVDDHDDEEDDEEGDDEEDEDDEEPYGSGSSNVSSDISESSSGSDTESSYDSFISIVETEDDSDLEFFDEQEGFAENFMSNLVSSTFGWFEKKQEQLVCGFKSGEFDGPSLLRESMTRQKKNEQDTARESRNNKAMKNLRNAVASKYAKENPSLLPMSTAASAVLSREKRGKDRHAKKSSRRSDVAGEPVEERKKSRRVNVPPSKKSALPVPKESLVQERIGREPPSKKTSEKGRKKMTETGSKPTAKAADKTERVKQHVDDYRKRSLVDNRKEESDSEHSVPVNPRADEKRKAGSRKAHSTPHQEEATVATTRTAATLRTVTSKKSTTSRTSSRSQTSQSQPMSARSSAPPNNGKLSHYNFDFLSSEDDDHGDGSSSVQVIDVRPAVPELKESKDLKEAKRAEKESRKSTKPKKVDAPDEGRKKVQAPTPSAKPQEPERTQPKEPKGNTASKMKGMPTNEHHLEQRQHQQPELPGGPLDVEPPKTKSKRSSNQSGKSATKGLPSVPPMLPTPRTLVEQRAQSLDTQDATKAPSSPPQSRTRSPSLRRTKSPSTSNGLQHDRDTPPGGSTVAAAKASKRSSASKASSSKPMSKKDKKASKKEKLLPSTTKESASTKASMSSSKRNAARHSRKKLPDARGRALSPTIKRDETDTDGDSANMTEEERERARKERRRAAALKRRRKLRERRRAKLEQNLTDDTFG